MKFFEKIYNTDHSKFVKPLSDTKMCCPFCGNPLVKTGEQRPLETLSEHVSNVKPTLKDVYVCSNDATACVFGRYRMYNYFGDGYRRNWPEFKNLDTQSKKDFDEYTMYATNSDGFKIDCEVSGRGQLREIRLHKLFMLGFGQPVIEFEYVFDKSGNVLKKKIHLGKYIKYDKARDLSTVEMLSIALLIDGIKRDIHAIRYFKKSNDSVTWLREQFEFPYNKAWYYRANTYITRMLYPILYYKYRKVVKAK